jgi:colanic acid biosynthesis glycosyl transferase WcaI
VRFLIVSQYFFPEIGAPQARLSAVVRQLVKRGHEVEVVTAMPHHLTGSVDTRYRGRFYSSEYCEGALVHRTWVYAARGTGVRRMMNYLSFTISCIFGLMKSKSPDLVFIESPPLFLAIPGIVFARLRHARVVLNVSDLWPDSVRELGVLRKGMLLSGTELLEKWAYRRSTFVNAVTNGIREILIKQKHVTESKVLLFPNGVDTEAFKPTPPNTSLAKGLGIEDRDVVLYAGTHGVAQGLETLIEAAKLLEEQQVVFLFVGDGSKKPDLEALVKRLQLRNVVFVASRPLAEMPQYYSLAFASIVPLLNLKLFESARPSKLFPSLSSGVPVIYCGAGETADFIQEEGAGLVASPGSATELANAILRLKNDKALRENMALRGRLLAVKEFDWGLIVSRWLHALQERLGPDQQLSPFGARRVQEKSP